MAERLGRPSLHHLDQSSLCGQSDSTRFVFLVILDFSIWKIVSLALCFLSIVGPVLGRTGNDILRFHLPSSPSLDVNTVCKTYPQLTARQYDLCGKYPDVTATAIQGVQIAVHECQFQLRTHRWNCSSLETKNKNPHSNTLLEKGYKETAFAYAISSAGVTHQVSTACSLGKLRSCGCDMSVYGSTGNWEWGGCSHNVDFGEQFAEKFLNFKEDAKDIHTRINLHNNRVGRLTVIQNVATKCKCHGMSGSCELRTCWKSTPNFREVGLLLRSKFDHARKIAMLNMADGSVFPKNHDDQQQQPPDRTELIYYEKSPSFCEPNPEINSVGTAGRLCDRASASTGNCETLCCGRGYNTMRVQRKERCDCKFHWCCYVVCDTCTRDEWVTACK